MTKRIIALLIVFVTLFSLVPSASAASSSVSVWDWIKALSPAAATGSALYDVISGSDDDGVAPSDRYAQYVSSLPFNGYSSDNSLLWYPTFSDMPAVSSQVSISGWVGTLGTNHADIVYPATSVVYNGVTYSFGSDNRSFDVYYYGSSSKSFLGPKSRAYSLIVPVSGTYTLTNSPATSVVVIGEDCGTVVGGSAFSNVGQSWHMVEGDSISQSVLNSADFPASISVYYISGKIMLPVYSVIPDLIPGQSSVTEQYYSSNTRMGNIGGNYGTINNDNSVTQYTTQYIVNEGDSTYINPVTGLAQPILDWSYNYDDRSYTLNLDNSKTSTVTYGDEKVSINETTIDGNGNTVTNKYEVNYIVNNGGGSSSDPDPSASPSPSGNPGGGGSGSGSGSGTHNSLSRVFANYAARVTQAYGHEGHHGTDCVPTSGVADTITAHSEGDVVWVQTGQVNDTNSEGSLKYGNAVKIQHSNGYYTLYAHLATVEVSQGDHVYKGQALGMMGNTGNSYGAHLHFEVRDANDTCIDSGPYLNADLPGLVGGGSSGGGIFDKLGELIGTGFSGFLQLVGAVISKVLDGLISLLEMLIGKLTTVVETVLSVFDQIPALFGGFLDLLGLLFPFLPPEIVTLLTFGIIAVVAIWIIKAVLGK